MYCIATKRLRVVIRFGYEEDYILLRNSNMKKKKEVKQQKKLWENPFNLLDSNIPLVFADGTTVYNELKKKYITHKTGYFILAPSGAG